MLNFIPSVAFLALARIGLAQWCDIESTTNVGGFILQECEIMSDVPTAFKIDLLAASLVEFVSISVKNPQVKAAVNFTVTVDGKWCGQIEQFKSEEIFQISCANGGIEGSVVELTAQPPIPNKFEFCSFNACGKPKPKTEKKYRTDFQSRPIPTKIPLNPLGAAQTWLGGAPNSPSYPTYGDASKCTTAQNWDREEWWSIYLVKTYTISAVEITTGSGVDEHLSDVLVTVSGQNCTNSLITAAHGARTTKIECSEYLTGSEVKIKHIGGHKSKNVLSLCEVNVFGFREQPIAAPHRINLHGDLAKQSSTFHQNTTAAMAIDGNDDTYTQTANFGIVDPWWSVDMGKVQAIHYIEITNRAPFEYLLGNVVVTVDDVPCGGILRRANTRKVRIDCTTTVAGRILKVQLANAPFGALSITEIEAYGTSDFNLVNTPEVPQLDLKNGLEMSKNDAKDFQKWLTITMDKPTLFRSVKVSTGKDFPKGYVVVSVDGKRCGSQKSLGGDQEMDITCSYPPVGMILKVKLLGVLSIKEFDVVKVEGFGYELQG